jgi:hypothetical protein
MKMKSPVSRVGMILDGMSMEVHVLHRDSIDIFQGVYPGWLTICPRDERGQFEDAMQSHCGVWGIGRVHKDLPCERMSEFTNDP